MPVLWLCFNLPDDKDWRTGNLTRAYGLLGSPGTRPFLIVLGNF